MHVACYSNVQPLLLNEYMVYAGYGSVNVRRFCIHACGLFCPFECDPTSIFKGQRAATLLHTGSNSSSEATVLD